MGVTRRTSDFLGFLFPKRIIAASRDRVLHCELRSFGRYGDEPHVCRRDIASRARDARHAVDQLVQLNKLDSLVRGTESNTFFRSVCFDHNLARAIPCFPDFQRCAKDFVCLSSGGTESIVRTVGPARSPSENCFLKAASATENRIVKTASQSSPREARRNARRRASRGQPSHLCVAFLARFYLYP